MGWNPWADLARRTHIVFDVHRLPDATGGAVYVRHGAEAFIIIDPRLDRTERRAALAHELIHDERGGGCSWPGMPDGWRSVAVREERRVNREVARRLVDPDDLWEFCTGMADIHLPVGPPHVAEYFDVPEWVAQIALEQLDQPGQVRWSA